MEKVLITGAAGYIGSVLTRYLLERGYFVSGLDMLMFDSTSLLGVFNNKRFEFFKGDIRNRSDLVNCLKDINTVIHLAAIVGDPACSEQPELAEETNWQGAKLLYDTCLETKNVKRFIFASTCSNYGKMKDTEFVNENSPLAPVSLYASLKVKFEKFILDSETRLDFTPVILRFATAYGLSARMRFDLTVNEFIKEIALNRLLKIYGKSFWRPYCHVEDISRAIFLVLNADTNNMKKNILGVGGTDENYQKKTIADLILKIHPSANIKYIDKKEDPRDYRVNFDKIRNTLNFTPEIKVFDGLKEINSAIKNGIFKNTDLKHYYNKK